MTSWHCSRTSGAIANECNSFYYDAISRGSEYSQQMPVKSLVGLIPLFAVLTLEPQTLQRFPDFTKRLDWFIDNRNDVAERNIASMMRRGKGDRLLLALVSKDRLKRILEKMLDEDEFLSPHGIRSLSKYHDKNPYTINVEGRNFTVDYVPGDSNSSMFGGNSNWRGVSTPCPSQEKRVTDSRDSLSGFALISF